MNVILVSYLIDKLDGASELPRPVGSQLSTFLFCSVTVKSASIIDEFL